MKKFSLIFFSLEKNIVKRDRDFAPIHSNEKYHLKSECKF